MFETHDARGERIGQFRQKRMTARDFLYINGVTNIKSRNNVIYFNDIKIRHIGVHLFFFLTLHSSNQIFSITRQF